MEHLIPKPWCFEAKKCTQEQWEIIKKYRAEVTKTDVKLTESEIGGFPIGYYVGINDSNDISGYRTQEHFGPNTKLYEPQELVDIIQGNKVEEVKGFKKGDYIVYLLESDSTYLRYNHCYIHNGKDKVRFITDKCSNGETTSNHSVKYDSNLWRYAEPNEIAEYNRLGKPYDVTTLKKENKLSKDNLVNGKVYYAVYKDRKFLFKQGFDYILRLYTKDILTHHFRATTEYTYQEATPEQVKHFEVCVKAGKYVELVKVEEIKPWSIGTYVVITSDYHSVNIGDVHKICGDNYKNCINITKSVGVVCLPFKNRVKWFATRKEAEEFSKTLIDVEEIPEYVECVVDKGWAGSLKIGTIYNTNIKVGETTWKEKLGFFQTNFKPSTKEAYEQQQNKLNMKTEFVSGKWYKNLGYSGSYIAKFEKMDGHSFCGTDYIYEEGYEKPNSLGNRITSVHKNAIECPLEEIQQYLPDGHPDKIIKEEDWCVRLTQENRDIIKDWMDDQSYGYTLDAHYGIKNGAKFGMVSSFGKILTTEGFLQKIGKTIGTSEYKVGDWIYTTEGCYGWGLRLNDENKLFKIENICNSHYGLRLVLDRNSNPKCLSINPSVKAQDIRKATNLEIHEHLFDTEHIDPQHTREINIVDYPYNNPTANYDLSKALQEQIRQIQQHGVMQHTIFEESLLKGLEHCLKTNQDSNPISLLRKNKSKILNTNIIPVQSISISLKTKLNKK